MYPWYIYVVTKVGDARRASVLDSAVQLASIDGLEGLTLGCLAGATGVTKSALQTLFGTKEDLQLKIVSRAIEVFHQDVLLVAEAEPLGLPQARKLVDAWLDYLQTFNGGCFFVAAASELDGRPGPLRDAVADAIHAGQERLHRQVELAVRLGELPAETDAAQLVFELHALLLKANHDLQLDERSDALDRARTAAHHILPRTQSA